MTWGYKSLDNEAAIDVRELWGLYFKKPGDEDHVFRKLKLRWADAVNYGDYTTNSQIIALYEIYRQNNLSIPKDLKTFTVDAINRELLEDNLEGWDEKTVRQETLLEYLKTVGGKVKKPTKPIFYNNKAIPYKNDETAINELMKLTKLKKRFGFTLDIHENPDMPQFIKTLDRLMTYHVWQADTNTHTASFAQRRMMLALYLGMTNDYSEDQIKKLLEDCKLDNWK
ncbi:MAG: hypothetical protein K0S33_3850 [Bacteroidetes bacterium]|jgi:hypothetical protein|nr:hypothetical protein [Bacteroidota bacterium]